jgi:hypothetical protein
MQRILPILVLFLLAGFSLQAQKLDFLGQNGVYFDRKDAEMNKKVVIMDSTSVYKDTALYIRNSRCLTYFRKEENLQLTGFNASSVQYQFCDKKLAYVFVDVTGENEIEKALKQLQLTFKKLGCKGKSLSECTQMDSSAKGMRIIINIDKKRQKMNFVLIPKAAAR